MTRPKTKILVDGGDPQETVRVKELLSPVQHPSRLLVSVAREFFGTDVIFVGSRSREHLPHDGYHGGWPGNVINGFPAWTSSNAGQPLAIIGHNSRRKWPMLSRRSALG